MKDQWKQLVNYKQCASKDDFNIDNNGMLVRKQKEIFNEFLNERTSKFDGVKD